MNGDALLRAAFGEHTADPPPDSETLDEAVLEHARFLGLDPDADAELMWIARQSLLEELPEGWVPLETDEGVPYFYCERTKQSRWEHPSDDYYRSLVLKHKRSGQGQGPGAGHGHGHYAADDSALYAHPHSHLDDGHLARHESAPAMAHWTQQQQDEQQQAWTTAIDDGGLWLENQQLRQKLAAVEQTRERDPPPEPAPAPAAGAGPAPGQEDELKELRAQVATLERRAAKGERLAAENGELRARVQQLQAQSEEHEARVARLQKQLLESQTTADPRLEQQEKALLAADQALSEAQAASEAALAAQARAEASARKHKDKARALKSEKTAVDQVAKSLYAELKEAQEALAGARGESAELKEARGEAARLAGSVKRLERRGAELQRELDEARASSAGEEQRLAEAVQSARKVAQAELRQQLAAKDEERRHFHDMFVRESALRRDLHERVLELQGNIRVFCRVRPMLRYEEAEGADAGGEDVADVVDAETLVLNRSEFSFDRVFGPAAEQADVFAEARAVVASCLDGHRVCLFAYGQTGTGKTHTMEGTPEDRGVNYRALDELFALSEARAGDTDYAFTLSMLEVYNETVRDLLAEEDDYSTRGLDVRTGRAGVFVEGLTEAPVRDAADVRELIDRGAQARSVGTNNINEHSSRSHLVITVRVDGSTTRTGAVIAGRLNLIDLAGSERLSKTNATGQAQQEAQFINRSLSALGDVVQALGAPGTSHIPYRNSKLTYLLTDSLTHNAKVLMFVTVSPAAYNAAESACSLNFASRCRAVQLGRSRCGRR